MATTTRPPLSPRTCARLALALLERNVAADTLWAFEEAGSAPNPCLVASFDVVDDLIGVRGYGWRGVALVASSTIDGIEQTICLVQSSCGCAAVAVRDRTDVVTSLDVSGGVDGFLVDVCRRILGLDCAPEPTPPIEAVWACWLTLILDVSADPSTACLARTWDDLVAMHPLCGHGGFFHDDGRAGTATEVAQRTDDLAGWWTWEWLRAESIELECDEQRSAWAHELDLDADDLEWMDVAMFARWMLSVHRGVDELLDDCSLFLEPALVDRLLCAVRTAHR